MHRYDELEKLYYRNKIKKFSIILIMLFLISGSCFVYKNYFIENKKKNAKIKFDFKKITTQDKPAKSNIIKDENKTSKINIKSQETNNTGKVKSIFVKKNISQKRESLTPNLSFVIPQIKDFNETNHINRQSVKKNLNSGNNSIKNKTNKEIPIIKEKQINITELIQSFNKKPSYDTAIIISKYYFNNNDLKNAKLWALRANNINPAKYESWEMFALILLKKNDKIKAKEVLRIYLNDYGENDEIYKLLRSINE